MEPIRTCIITRKQRPKSELIRLVRQVDDNDNEYVTVDFMQKMEGRGVYVSKDLDSYDNLFGKGKLKHFLKLQSNLTEENIKQIKEDLLKKV